MIYANSFDFSQTLMSMRNAETFKTLLTWDEETGTLPKGLDWHNCSAFFAIKEINIDWNRKNVETFNSKSKGFVRIGKRTSLYYYRNALAFAMKCNLLLSVSSSIASCILSVSVLIQCTFFAVLIWYHYYSFVGPAAFLSLFWHGTAHRKQNHSLFLFVSKHNLCTLSLEDLFICCHWIQRLLLYSLCVCSYKWLGWWFCARSSLVSTVCIAHKNVDRFLPMHLKWIISIFYRILPRQCIFSSRHRHCYSIHSCNFDFFFSGVL